MLFWPIFANFQCPVVTLVTFGSNLSNFEINPKKPKNTKKIQIFFKKNPKKPKTKKSPVNQKKSKKNPKKKIIKKNPLKKPENPKIVKIGQKIRKS